MTQVIFFLFVGLLAVAAWWRPPTAFAGMICVYGLQQWADANDAFFTRNHALLNAGVSLIIGSAILVKIQRRDNPFRDLPNVGWLSAALYTYAFLTYFWALAPEHLANNFELSAPRLTVFLLLVPMLITKIDDVRDAFYAAIAFGFVVLLLLWFNTELSQDYLESKTANAAHEYTNYLETGSLAGRVGLLTLFINVKRWPRIWMLGRWVVLGVVLLVLVSSTARGQMGAFAIAAVVLSLLNFRVRQARIMQIAVALTICVFVGQWAFDTMSQTDRYSVGEMESSYREGRIEPSVIMLRYWWGTGSVSTLLFGLGNSAAYDYRLLGGYPHFTLLEILAEEGILGVFLFVTILTQTVKEFWRGYCRVRDDDVRRGQVSSLFALFLFEVILSCKQGSLLGNCLLFAFATMASRYVLFLRPLNAAQRLDLPRRLTTESIAMSRPSARRPASGRPRGASA